MFWKMLVSVRIIVVCMGLAGSWIQSATAVSCSLDERPGLGGTCPCSRRSNSQGERVHHLCVPDRPENKREKERVPAELGPLRQNSSGLCQVSCFKCLQ